MSEKYGATSVEIPESVEVIAEGAFRCWIGVKRGPKFIENTENVMRIENKAFHGCPSDVSLGKKNPNIILMPGWNDIGADKIMTSTSAVLAEENYLNEHYPERAFQWEYDREGLFDTRGKITEGREIGYNHAESSITIGTNSEVPLHYFLRQLPVWIYVVDEDTGAIVQKIWSGYGTESKTYPGEVVEMLCYIARDKATFDYTWYDEIYDSIQETSSKFVIAKLRLQNPIDLPEKAKKKYRSQLLKGAWRVLEKAVRTGNVELLREYKELNAITKSTRKYLWENMPEAMDVEIIQLLQGE